jgi:hypothetical protein
MTRDSSRFVALILAIAVGVGACSSGDPAARTLAALEAFNTTTQQAHRAIPRPLTVDGCHTYVATLIAASRTQAEAIRAIDYPDAVDGEVAHYLGLSDEALAILDTALASSTLEDCFGQVLEFVRKDTEIGDSTGVLRELLGLPTLD